RISLDEFLQLPEDNFRNHELLEGMYFVNAPTIGHQIVVARLAQALQEILARHPVYCLLHPPADLRFGPDTILQPDIFVFCSFQNMADSSWDAFPTPLLVIEVVSPATESCDRGIKKRVHMEGGVRTNWIVDAGQQQIECWWQGQQTPELSR